MLKAYATNLTQLALRDLDTNEMNTLTLYKHIRCKDMVIMPMRITYNKWTGSLDVLVRYFTLGYSPILDLGLVEVISISAVEYDNWKEFHENN